MDFNWGSKNKVNTNLKSKTDNGNNHKITAKDLIKQNQ